MSNVLERLRSMMRRNPRPQQLPPGSFSGKSGNAGTLGTITKPAYQDNDDDDEDIESLRNYNVPEQTRLRGQQTDTIQSEDVTQNRNPSGSSSMLSPGSLNPPNAPFRSSSSGFVLGLPMNNNFNNNMNSSSNTNIGTTPNLPSRAGLPFLSQIQDPYSQSALKSTSTSTNNPQSSFNGFPPGMNLNRPAQPPPRSSQPSPSGFPSDMNLNQSAPSPPNNPQSSVGGFPPGMNLNQSAPSPPNNRQSSVGGFPPGMNLNQSAPSPPNNLQSSVGGFPPGMKLNQSAPPQPNNPQSSLGGFPSGINPNQSETPASSNLQPSFGSVPPGMNLNQTQSPPNNSQSPLSRILPGINTNQTSSPSSTTNPQSNLAGFPPGMNSQSSPSISNLRTNDSNNLGNTQQGSFAKPISLFQNQSNDNDDNVSRLELDYPIENVLIDANIPSAMAIKINETVEKDRLGNAYHIHRYTFEPPAPQQISFANNQHISRRSLENPHHGGTRHVREIYNDNQNSYFDDIAYPQRSHKHYQRQRHPHSETAINEYIDQLLHTPGSTVIQAQNYNDLQHILNPYLSNTQIIPTQPLINPFQSNTSTYGEPVFYYTARALYNDPMRNY